MALKRSLARGDNSLRYEFPNAYFKVMKAEMNTERNKLIIQIKAFGDEQSRRFEDSTSQNTPMPGMNMGRTIYEKTYEVDPSVVPTSTTATTVKDQLIQSSYLWLKQKSGDFTSATDVLENGQ